MMPMYGSSVGKVPLLLLALAAGYAVLVLSQRQERPLDVLGRFLGALILVVSFVGLLCVAWCSLGHCRKNAEMCSYGRNTMAPCKMPMTDQPPADAPLETK